VAHPDRSGQIHRAVCDVCGASATFPLNAIRSDLPLSTAWACGRTHIVRGVGRWVRLISVFLGATGSVILEGDHRFCQFITPPSRNSMARLRRCYEGSHLHYLTCSTYRRTRAFDAERFKFGFVDVLRELRLELEFKLVGFTILGILRCWTWITCPRPMTARRLKIRLAPRARLFAKGG
jgi:hypothetical protein